MNISPEQANPVLSPVDEDHDSSVAMSFSEPTDVPKNSNTPTNCGTGSTPSCV